MTISKGLATNWSLFHQSFPAFSPLGAKLLSSRQCSHYQASRYGCSPMASVKEPAGNRL